MEDSKTLWFYIFGLASLIGFSVLFTRRIGSPEIAPLPATAAPTVAVVRPTSSPAEVDQKVCPLIPQKLTLYQPDMATPEDHRLVISGAVYTSDFATPLPGALIEVLLVARESQYHPPYPPYHVFHDWFQADGAGQYKVTLPNPDDYGTIHLHYRANYEDDCPLKLQLFFIDAFAQAAASFPRMKQVPHTTLPASSPLPAGLELVQGKVGGVLLRGPIDIVLPVPAVEGKTTTN